MIEEPQLALEDIQGHVLPGFGGRTVLLLALQMLDPSEARKRLGGLLGDVTTMATANDQRNRRRDALATGRQRPVESKVSMAWSFSYLGLKKLGADLEGLREQRFSTGMARDAAELNDPVDAEGVPEGWVVGDTETKTPDLLIVLEADEPTALARKGEYLLEQLGASVAIIYEEHGSRRPDEKEHFGFRDGVSQPAPRGLLKPDQPFMRRAIVPEDPRHQFYAKPGQPLVWPGQFVFGYPEQTEDPLRPGPVRPAGPSWMNNGSFLVFRRLTQDVAAFRARFSELAASMTRDLGRTVEPAWLMAQAVGRWPDGTPVVAEPGAPNPELASDRMRLNHFNFSGPAPAVEVMDSDGQVRSVPGVPGDPLASRCPHLAHIRKVNPRDDSTDIGSNRTNMKLILRRGANFGPAFADQPNRERGLLFLSYQTSLEHQFVFLQKNWANALSRPSGIGKDLIIGRSNEPANRRTGLLQIDGRMVEIDMRGDWVRCTGGGYFFSPSVSALRELLGKEPS